MEPTLHLDFSKFWQVFMKVMFQNSTRKVPVYFLFQNFYILYVLCFKKIPQKLHFIFYSKK